MPLTVIQPAARGFGETARRDAWWVTPLVIFSVLSGFIVYATWAAFQGKNYHWGPYLSPFYSPEIWGESPHAWFGPKPGWWPGFLPFSPALLILGFPAGFRFTCYYYRGAYYKSFWADPPSCTVGEPRKGYRGEQSLPLILQNIHRYFLYAALVFVLVLAHDVWKALWWEDPATGGVRLGLGLGTLVLAVNVVLLGGYTFGCHSFRHLVGGNLDCFSCSRRTQTRYKLWTRATWMNLFHMRWAWASLISVALADLYIRLLAMGVITDPAIYF
jgi:hypothetical protein